MKLATYTTGTQSKLGIVHSNDEKIFDVQAAAKRSGADGSYFGSMLSLIDAGEAALDEAHRLFDAASTDEQLSTSLSSIHLQSPLPDPRHMRDGM